MPSLLRALRPGHWIKNLFVLAPLLFARALFEPAAVANALLAFLSFCLASSAGYLWNDVADRARDRVHPAKRGRPVASGELSAARALVSSIALLLLATGAAAFVAPEWTRWPLAYAALSLAYSLAFKHAAYVDVLVIAIGFEVRVFAGGAAIGVQVSSWLVLCTFFLALVLALGKRLQARWGGDTIARPSLARYDERTLELLLGASAAALLLGYALYTVADRTVREFGGRGLVLTLPFAFYGIARYLQRLRESGSRDPVEVLLRDPPLLLCLAAWVATVLLVAY